MIALAASCILILTATNVSAALTIDLTTPSEVKINDSFDVTIAADTSDKHDVKLFVYQDSYSDIISEIKKSGDWSNPFYYTKEAFPDQKTFQLRVLEAPGTRELCVRLRKTGGSSFDQTCTNITLIASQTESNEDEDQQDNTEEEEESEQNEEEDKQEPEDNTGEASPSATPLTLPSTSGEQIILNPSQEQPSKEEVFITQDEKHRRYLIYSFTAFTLIIILLLALRKL
ncbi:hypothetical protein CMI48_03415 [Candidatus Pacearchaeota archaeon]|nr:hypothetical protein [Candidatus Pacearchaeota archaeon]